MCSEHQSDLISGLELKLVFDSNIHRVVDSDNQVIIIKTNRKNYVVFAEFLIQKCCCLRININARQVNNRVIILTGYGTQDVKFRHQTAFNNNFSQTFSGFFLHTEYFCKLSRVKKTTLDQNVS